jgi:hypothetical protein
MRISSVVLSVVLALSGCSVYQPKAPVPESVLTNNYLADLESPTLQSSYDAMPDGPLKAARRNAILYEYIWLVDASYDSYEAKFFSGQAYVATAVDFSTMGLNAASAVTGTAALKSVLSVIAGGITGSNASYQKNFFDQQTREVVVGVMRSARLTQLAVIETGMASNSDAYTLQQGLLDVSEYYRAGTVIGALETISNSSSAASATARQAIKNLRH